MIKTESFVLDCSVTMTWILSDDKMTEKANEILSLLNKSQAKVPMIWSLEVANVLYHAEVSKKITEIEVSEFKEFLAALPIHIDNSTSVRALGSIYVIAKSKQLTIYDAAYLELALRENIPLATFDKALKKAAQQVNIVLL